MTIGHHPVACSTPGCPHGTYRKCGVCRQCDPPAGYMIRRTRYPRPVQKPKVIGARRRGQRPLLYPPDLCPSDYLAACAAELAKRQAERIAAVERVCADLRAEAM